MDQEKINILSDIFGKYQKEKKEYLFLCPSCNHHKRKLSINLQKNIYKCWICSFSGKIAKLIKQYGSENQFQEWLSLTNQVDHSASEDEKSEEKKVFLPKEFVTLTDFQNDFYSSEARKYLNKRKVAASDILRWKIGFAHEGEYTGRIIIPSFDNQGLINYFVSRSYDGNFVKYKNPPNDRKNIIFNELYLYFDEPLIIVEGVFDAIRAGGNVVPLLDSILNEKYKLFQKIVENKTKIYLALDPDVFHKENKIINLLMKYDIEVCKVEIKPYKDVGIMPKSVFWERLESSISVNQTNSLKRKLYHYV